MPAKSTATLIWTGVTARRIARHALAEPASGLRDVVAELGQPPAQSARSAIA